MTTVIDGIRLTISGAELQAHLLGRQTYHETRAQQCAAMADQMRDALEGWTEPSPTASTSPAAHVGMADRADQHRQKAALFAFRAAHLEVAATYRLSEYDCQAVELIERAVDFG